MDFTKQLPYIGKEKNGVVILPGNLPSSFRPDYQTFKLSKYNTQNDCAEILLGIRHPSSLAELCMMTPIGLAIKTIAATACHPCGLNKYLVIQKDSPACRVAQDFINKKPKNQAWVDILLPLLQVERFFTKAEGAGILTPKGEKAPLEKQKGLMFSVAIQYEISQFINAANVYNQALPKKELGIQIDESNRNFPPPSHEDKLNTILKKIDGDLNLFYDTLKKVMKDHGGMLNTSLMCATAAFKIISESITILILEDIEGDFYGTDKSSRDIQGGIAQKAIKRLNLTVYLSCAICTDRQKLYKRIRKIRKACKTPLKNL